MIIIENSPDLQAIKVSTDIDIQLNTSLMKSIKSINGVEFLMCSPSNELEFKIRFGLGYNIDDIKKQVEIKMNDFTSS